MASVRDLKKDINFVLGDIIEAVYQWEVSTENKNSEKGSKLIDSAIAAFDELMDKVHAKDVENTKAHYKSIRVNLEKKATGLIEKLNKLQG
ncbi:hypothetical protein MTsPCn9_28290 [Croceitalea sp. MTPC9]|uniref:hypothetical protein n=1 Tax=unclassified Croceitalea TaxID=2632280 RepID=UPI002B3DF4F0|nr:hypothetical protein MTsPCn6_29780 [Croceitalea sp. MTPC6]GMN17889.1 hypothetical protein MTsPCn9_28290 [Croceitalea sp. MTPC9]